VRRRLEVRESASASSWKYGGAITATLAASRFAA
jgi:hypothetical protein